MASSPTIVNSTAPTSQLSSFAASSSENAGLPSPLKSSQTGLPSLTTSPSVTNSESTPGSTALNTTETIQTSELGSIITSVIVVPVTPSWTSTITIWSTSTDGNGILITTQPTSTQADLASEVGILHNTGAVAGIFSVVGVIFASLVVGLIICLRRRHKILQREKWLAGMHAQQPSSSDDPFRVESLPPAMRTLHTDVERDPLDRKGFLAPEDSSHGHLNFGQSKASIFPVYPISKDGTFGQPEIHQQTIDMSPTESKKARYSLVSSTPSIYPVSIGDEDKVSNDIVIVPSFNQNATTSNLPPRPPRSLLRERSIKVVSTALSIQSEPDHSNQTYVVSEPRSRDYVHVIDRKTILDVHSRPITQ